MEALQKSWSATPVPTPKQGTRWERTPPGNHKAGALANAGIDHDRSAAVVGGITDVHARELLICHWPAMHSSHHDEVDLLSGDPCVAEEVLGPGDYQLAKKDSLHPEQSTREGCLLLITSSTSDRLIEGT